MEIDRAKSLKSFLKTLKDIETSSNNLLTVEIVLKDGGKLKLTVSQVVMPRPELCGPFLAAPKRHLRAL